LPWNSTSRFCPAVAWMKIGPAHGTT
jgi:hypothetical protein